MSAKLYLKVSAVNLMFLGAGRFNRSYCSEEY
jgi:hypothetical protein